MQLTTADHRYSNFHEPILNLSEITTPPNDNIMIYTLSNIYPENNATGILQPSDILHEEGDITFCPALVTLNDRHIQICEKNFTDNPFTLKKGTHIANFSVMTPEQLKHFRPIDPIAPSI